MSNSSKSFFLKVLFVITVFIFIFIETISFLILNIYPNLSYDENKITQSFNEYKIKRDTILGWNKVVNEFGNSRNLPNREFVKDTSTQIDFYGDSYTYGAEVNDDKHIWTNLISKELKVIVNNKGVGGFGSTAPTHYTERGCRRRRSLCTREFSFTKLCYFAPHC